MQSKYQTTIFRSAHFQQPFTQFLIQREFKQSLHNISLSLTLSPHSSNFALVSVWNRAQSSESIREKHTSTLNIAFSWSFCEPGVVISQDHSIRLWIKEFWAPKLVLNTPKSNRKEDPPHKLLEIFDFSALLHCLYQFINPIQSTLLSFIFII